YGFLHAVGPGHGKVILGSTALTGEVPLRRMLAIGLAASLAQSGTAILLVGAGFGAAAMSGGSASLTEDTLADISRWAIAAIGALMLWQGGRRLWRLHRPPDATQHHTARDAVAAMPTDPRSSKWPRSVPRERPPR
ncbi:hypothetical protein GXP64_08815, partial [Rhodovulum sulfidophilum]|nr:hypothetical protein [Rhodovulum sulfidophilum]